MTRDDIAFMVQEIISEAHTRKKGASMQDLTEKYVKKFVSNSPPVVPEQEKDKHGTYQCKCCICERIFLGHKREVTCEDCTVGIGTSAVGTGKQYKEHTNICICGHADNRHADIEPTMSESKYGEWGVGKCELCNCTRFEPKCCSHSPARTNEWTGKQVDCIGVCEECSAVFNNEEMQTNAQWGHVCRAKKYKEEHRCEAYRKIYVPKYSPARSEVDERKHPCGSKTLYKDGEDAICGVCGYRINNYKKLELILGHDGFKKFESNIK